MSWFLIRKHTCFPNAHAPIEYNVIASQSMGYKLCIVGQRWKYTLLLIGFVHLHRVICLIHVYVQHTQLGNERLSVNSSPFGNDFCGWSSRESNNQ